MRITLHDELVKFLQWQEHGAATGDNDDVFSDDQLVERYLLHREVSRFVLPRPTWTPPEAEQAAANALAASGWDVFAPGAP